MKAIKEYFVERLQKTKIFEMAYSRSRYMDEVFRLRHQLIENWCLLRYSTLNGKLQEHNHWLKELRAHILNLAKMDIKVDKKKATTEVLIYGEEANNPKQVIWLISHKWGDEGFDIDSNLTEEVVDDFVEYGIYELIDIICKKRLSNNELNEYLNNI